MNLQEETRGFAVGMNAATRELAPILTEATRQREVIMRDNTLDWQQRSEKRIEHRVL